MPRRLLMPPRLPAVLFCLAFPLIFAPDSRAAEPADPLQAALADLAALRTQEGARQLESLLGGKSLRDDPSRRHTAELGLAAALLNLQPRTQANIGRSAGLLQRLLDTTPAPEPELACAARFLLARIEEDHRVPARPHEAMRHYAVLAGMADGCPLAQQAVVHLCRLLLFSAAANDPGRLEEVFSEAGAFATRMTNPAARRDYHLLLAQAGLFHGRPAAGNLAHLQAAEAAGISSALQRGNVLVAMGELSRQLGRREAALSAYRRFMAEFPRDPRVDTLRRRITALEAPIATTR